MSDFERASILGTDQVPSSSELTGSGVDALVEQVGSLTRERAFLLRAGGLALLHRAAYTAKLEARRVGEAHVETLRAPSAKLTGILGTLLSDGQDELLRDALESIASAGLRLPEELLPEALGRTQGQARAALRPVLGERGRWLAELKSEWAWAITGAALTDPLPEDIEARWEEASTSERKVWLRTARAGAPELARKLIRASWKQEKADQRLAWLEIMAEHVSPDDEPFLMDLAGDRSAPVRNLAARLLWQLPTSVLAQRLRERAESLITFTAPAGGMFAKLRAVVGAAARGTLDVALPPETFEPDWEKEGIVESAPEGIGRRQWWLAQLVSAVPPNVWARKFGLEPAALVELACAHDLADALIDGLSAAALRHAAKDWVAPLYDAWADDKLKPRLGHDPRAQLAAQLCLEDAEPRMLAALKAERLELLPPFPRPWPRTFAERFVREMGTYRAGWAQYLGLAALAIPVDVLPAEVPVPEIAEQDYSAHLYLRALDQFLSVAQTRRAIAEEIAL